MRLFNDNCVGFVNRQCATSPACRRARAGTRARHGTHGAPATACRCWQGRFYAAPSQSRRNAPRLRKRGEAEIALLGAAAELASAQGHGEFDIQCTHPQA